MTERDCFFDKLSIGFLLFAAFCHIGWLCEVSMELLYGNGFSNRGFMLGPYLPIYGFGILIICATADLLYAERMTTIKLFFLFMLIATVLELLTGMLLDALYHKKWWDYSADFFSYRGLICPRISLLFGIGGIVAMNLLRPFFIRQIKKIPDTLRKSIALMIFNIFLFDWFTSLYRNVENF